MDSNYTCFLIIRTVVDKGVNPVTVILEGNKNFILICF